MSYQLIKEFNREVWIKLVGKLTVSDLQELQALARSSLVISGQFRALIELEDFQGWSKETAWENSVFLEDHEGSLSKLVFVGDEKWKVEVFMFTGQPMREIAIEFFPKGQIDQAKAWLSGENIPVS